MPARRTSLFRRHPGPARFAGAEVAVDHHVRGRRRHVGVGIRGSLGRRALGAAAQRRRQDAVLAYREAAAARGVQRPNFIKAETALSDAQAAYNVANNLNERLKNGKNIDDMTRRQLYLLMKDAALKAKEVDPKWTSNNIDQDLRDEAQQIFDDAKSDLKDAQNAYDDAVTTDGAKDVQKARAQVSRQCISPIAIGSVNWPSWIQLRSKKLQLAGSRPAHPPEPSR